MSLALIFPGQGAQFVGMGQELIRSVPAAARAFREAAAAADLDLEELVFQGPAERLNETERTQPALVAVSAAVLAALEEHGVRPAAVAGLSLGEYTALVAAGAARLGEVAALVRLRGRYMQEAVPLGEGGMAAVLGLGPGAVERLCAAARGDLPGPAPAGGWVLEPANFNCPGQIVVAGHAAAVAAAIALGKEFGARRVTPLPVSAPFHCRLMASAAARLGPAIDRLHLERGRVPVVANVHARPLAEPEEIRAALLEQMQRPVLWEDVVRQLGAMGCDTFVEVGPGRALGGFVSRILPQARVLQCCDPESLAQTLSALGEGARGGA